MFEKARSGRDAFTFSLRGLTTIASYTVAPAIADDRLNNAIACRLAGGQKNQRSVTREIEDMLARYFAPGCCQGA